MTSFFRLLLVLACPAISATAADLKLLSYNVWYGFTEGKPERHQEFRDWVKHQAPDIVALQELNGYTREKLKADAASWGHPHSALLKTDGFPTGITSSQPITNITRQLKGFHHGLLKVHTHGHTVYIIHLHPSNWQTRHQEIDTIIQNLEPDAILLGDFNTFSRRDEPFYLKSQLIPFFANRDKTEKEKNLANGKLDYGVIDKIESTGFVDVVAKFRNPDASGFGTFPTRLRANENHGDQRRLDFIFVSKKLAAKCTSAQIVNDERTQMLSDHLPLTATFK